jgi:hypothetical protein
MVVKLMNRLAVDEQRSLIPCREVQSQETKEVEGKEQYSVGVSNMFAALEDLDNDMDINSAWELVRDNITISADESLGYNELRKHKPWCDRGCSILLDQRKQAKLQWLWDPSQIDGDNLDIVKVRPAHISRRRRRNI